MNSDKIRFVSALSLAHYTTDDVREWQEIRPNVWRILIHTHRVTWYRLTSDGRMSPE